MIKFSISILVLRQSVLVLKKLVPLHAPVIRAIGMLTSAHVKISTNVQIKTKILVLKSVKIMMDHMIASVDLDFTLTITGTLVS